MVDPLHAFDGIVRRLSLPGQAGGPLAGTSFVVKDLYDVAGYPTGAGNPDWERTHPIPTATAETDPLDEPPGRRSGKRGLTGVP